MEAYKRLEKPLELVSGARCGKALAATLMQSCAQTDCYYNDDCQCQKTGYTGPTCEEACPHYSKD